MARGDWQAPFPTAALLPSFYRCIPLHLWRSQRCLAGKKKNFPRLPLWLAVSQLSFPSLTVITKPPSKAGFGGVLALPIWSMRLHRRLLRGVTGSTSWPCTKCERQADIYVSAPPGRTLRLFMGKMNFGHEDHYSKCKLTNIFLERLSFFLF